MKSKNLSVIGLALGFPACLGIMSLTWIWGVIGGFLLAVSFFIFVYNDKLGEET
jgi:hypothetical protein